MVLHPFPWYHDYKIPTSFSSRRDKRGGGNGTRGYSHLHDLGFFHFIVPLFVMIHIQSATKKNNGVVPSSAHASTNIGNLHVH